MKITLDHARRYSRIARLLWKYGRGDLIERVEVDGGLDQNAAAKNGGGPDELADDLEKMGPTYIKLGQVLSSRPDLLPEPYVKALARLQDKVKPFPFAEVERIILEQLGVRVSKAFSHFEPEPLAAASLGQVHAATLRDGREVVVKIQRPDIRRDIAEEFEVLAQIATFVDAHTELGRRQHFSAVLEEFQTTLHQELDYHREAQNLRTLGQNLEEFARIEVPQPINGYCTGSVLTMERVDGHKLTTLSRAALVDIDGRGLAEELFRAYLKQVISDGFFHADPHPGNVFLTSDDRIALLDLGMVGHVTPSMREHLLKLLLALSDGKGDQAAEIAIGFSEKTDAFNAAGFSRDLSHMLASRQGQRLEELNVGRSLLEVAGTALDNGLRVPNELTLLGKTLMQLDEIGRVLDPQFDPDESIRRNIAELATRRMFKSATQGNVFNSLLEAKSLLLQMPSRLNRILESVANSELEVKVKSTDAKMIVEGIEKIANRITVGLVLAALIVGAALLMRVQTSFTLFGYPGFAMLCFSVAGAGGFWLVATTLISDRRSKMKRER